MSSHVATVIAQQADRLNDSQRVDLLYLEYLSKQSSGVSAEIGDLCTRYPESADKLLRQIEVDTELSRLDGETDPLGSFENHVTAIEHIGAYTVIEKIGEGSQAEVFRVIHPMLRCELAMKVGKCKTAATDRILEEGRLLVTVNDPGIARVIDAGVWHDRPFIVSELIRGTTLKQRVDDRTLTQTQLVEALIRLACTVQTLHEAGIVHCDIKPANVLVDANGLPKLVDFGLAINRGVDVWDENATGRQDHSGGTLAYMAPELLTSDNNRDERRYRKPVSDVFSLGALLYFGLVGNHPYASRSSLNVVDLVATGQWDRDVLRNADTPSQVIRICEAALATDPGKRTASASDFADELQCWLEQRTSRPLYYKTILAISIAVFSFVGLVLWRSNSSQMNFPLPLAVSPSKWITESKRLGLLDVKVWSEQYAFELVHRVPIATGEGLQVNASLRGGRQGELWIVSSEGKPERLAGFAAEDQPRWVHYPAKLDQAVPLTGPAGTEVIVWLELPASKELSTGIYNEQTAEILRPSTQWPSIGDALVFRIVDGVLTIEQSDRSLGLPQDINAPLATVQKHLRDATHELNRQGIGVEMIAFTHAE
ncbi:serine/threonine-protein kinase [Neorhodopirellula pilleata]|uniref:Serine/threonine-protein kinase PknL n=1 Tax=Neorhodopirellula pilleata TaxID=2714738 RepID=A0A5C6AD43_9BACT|nr:serine/threonine-protein kinase [Neorhodopirellula pilleata]TWT97218.1 Serine/threonine-protein kinase PknL [Neorhodopirellula pilleata]